MSKTLHLPLKKEWFDMILSGVKLEEYRELKGYWYDRLMHFEHVERNSLGGACKRYTDCKHFDTITFRNGYAKDAPMMIVDCKGITIGPCRPEWSGSMQGDHFIISLGKIISTKNIK